MDRRTFLLLSGATSAALVRPSTRDLPPASVARPGTGVGRLRFDLDDQRRWSLWYHGDGPPVPLIQGATLGVWIGAGFVTLADLEYTTVGNRRPPGGESVVVRGRAAGVVLETELFSGSEAAVPRALVSLTVFPDQELPTIRGVRFLQETEQALMPGSGDLLALINGRDSAAPCHAIAASIPSGAADVASHGTLGLSRGGRGLALAFDAADPGDGRITLGPNGLEAVSDWAPPRPCRPEGDTSKLLFCYAPGGDGVDALRDLFVPASAVDQARLAAAPCPTGWSGRSTVGVSMTEDSVIANLEACAARFDRRFVRYVQIEDGYQRSVGDWDANAGFPHGHRWLTDQIHAKGLQAGLWIAPFAVSDASGVPAAHPEWLLRGADAAAPLVSDTLPERGGRLYTLDPAHPAAREWIFNLARRTVQEWGYDCLTLDCLGWSASDTSHYGGLTRAEAYRLGLGALREGAGTEAILLGAGASLQHAAGFVNGMRVGPDVTADWNGIQMPALSTAQRSFYQRGAWLNDPDRLVVGSSLSLAEARTWTSVVAISGGVTLLGDDLPSLPAERFPLLARALPAAATSGQPIGVIVSESPIAPALVAGDTVVRLAGAWKFRTGDEPAYGTREFDETAWESVAVPGTWDGAGHAGYVGLAWYRCRFTLPAQPGAAAQIALGKIADADEAFVNGTKIGQTGSLPPSFQSARDLYRRYAVGADVLNWGGENVLAVRVYSAARGGGIWSVLRESPPQTWVNEAAPGWWTVVLTNWEDRARDLTVSLAELGIAGRRFAAYDVWRDALLPDVTDAIAAKVDAHDTAVIAVRAVAARPQVVGTSRHVVQGAVDIAEEKWDADARTLSGRSVNLDDRPYAITIAVPKGLRYGECKADPACAARALDRGGVVLEWARPEGRDIAWTVKFRPAAAAGRSGG